MPSIDAPGRSRPITRSHAETDWRSSELLPLMSGSCCSGIHKSGGSLAQRFAKESRRRDADDGERVAFHDEGRADDSRIAAVFALPGMMTEHRDGRRPRTVVVWRQHPPAERTHAERRKVIAGDDTRSAADAPRFRRPARRTLRLPAAGLERGEFLELRRRRFDALDRADTNTCPSDPAVRPPRSSRRLRRSGTAGRDRRPAATAASPHGSA